MERTAGEENCRECGAVRQDLYGRRIEMEELCGPGRSGEAQAGWRGHSEEGGMAARTERTQGGAGWVHRSEAEPGLDEEV